MQFSRIVRSPHRFRPLRLLFVIGALASLLGALAMNRYAAAGSRPSLVANPAVLDEVRKLQAFKRHVETLIDARLKAEDAEHVSLYFSDLAAGPGFGIDEDFRFAPASLMKVPVMMAYLKLAEEDPRLLDLRLTVSGKSDYTANQGVKPAQRLEPGTAYTVDELLRRMIAYSDNNALVLLLGRLDKAQLEALLGDLHVDYQQTPDGGRISVKSYARFFNALYNGTYLGPRMNAKALRYLEQDDFTAGLLAGVPRGIPVAAKFGEWALGTHSEVRQLQEFGIVFHGQPPYLLGVAGQDGR